MRARVSTAKRNARVVRTLGFVDWVLRRLRADVYVPPEIEEDVRAAGVAGLVRAARRFQPGKGSWLGYAYPSIRGAMLDALTRWQATIYWSRDGRILIQPELLPLKTAASVPGRDEEAEVNARIAVAEILDGARQEHRDAMEAYMQDEDDVPGLAAAIRAARRRLGVDVQDTVGLGRTFPADRFWAHAPDRPDRGCWLWRGTTTRQGYGQFSAQEGGRRWRHYLAHRVAWLLERGELPRGARVTQTCGDRRCVRPDHLRVDTRRLTALAAILAALLLAGCVGGEPPQEAAQFPQAEVFGVFGVFGQFDETGRCRPPVEVAQRWLLESDEYMLVTVCLRPDAPHIEFRFRDNGARFPRRRMVSPPAWLES